LRWHSAPTARSWWRPAGGPGCGTLANPARAACLVQPVQPPVLGHSESFGSVAFSPDGKMLAAGSADDKAWLWNTAGPSHPACLGHALTVGPADSFGSVAFSPDGDILTTGNSLVWLWNVAKPGRPAREGQPLTGPSGGIGSVKFSPDGKILAVGSGDGKVWLWNLANPARPARLGQPLTGPTAAVSSVAFSPDGKILAAGSNDGSAYIWSLDVDNAIARICATTRNTLTRAQWEQYLPQLPYNPVGAENLCHLGICPMECGRSWSSFRRRPGRFWSAWGGMIFGLRA
jgi:dipeptidyl aminopeptidase/acylaminoacyl peptidase